MGSAGSQRSAGSRSGQITEPIAEQPGSKSDSVDRNEWAASRLDEGGHCFDYPLDSFDCASDCSVSVNLSALESNRGSLHRHLEGSDGSKPTGRVLSRKRNRRRSRVRINQCRNSEGVSPTMWSRRRRSVGCGPSHAVHERFAGTRRRAHARSHTEQVHMHQMHMHMQALTSP